MTFLATRTALYRHPAFTGHDTTPHPENPSRLVTIDAELQRRGLLENRPTQRWQPASDEQITRVHDAALLAALETLTNAGGGAIDSDTYLFTDSLNAARIAAGAGIHASESIRAGAFTRAFVAGRPPGHHATRDRAMGFCLLNTIAITAAHARSIGFERVAIIDWDVHHGNGTQDIFYDRADVLFCSIHQYGNVFPGTGSARERGHGAGEGYTLNVPLQAGDDGNAIIAGMTNHIMPAVRAFQPDLILLSAGYDAHREDPLGGLRATDADFRTLTTLTRNLADELTDGRLITVLEGGYQPAALARCVADTIQILDALPEAPSIEDQ